MRISINIFQIFEIIDAKRRNTLCKCQIHGRVSKKRCGVKKNQSRFVHSFDEELMLYFVSPFIYSTSCIDENINCHQVTFRSIFKSVCYLTISFLGRDKRKIIPNIGIYYNKHCTILYR